MTPPTRTSVALHGAGMIAMAHAASARQLGMDLLAVASRTPARAEKVATTFGCVATTYDALPGDADVVVVATPPQCHADDTVRLLDAGAAVLVEKPLCRTLDEADRMVAAAARNGQRLLYGENLAYAPVITTMVGLAARVGPPTDLEVRSLQGLPTWGAFTTDEWGGGALFDLGVHPLAVAMLLANAAGLGRVAAVSATLRGGAGHRSDEHADVRLHFASGLRARVVASWQAGPEPVWDAQLAGELGVVRAEIFPAPTLEYNGDPVQLPMPQGSMPLLEQLGYAPELQALVDDAAAHRAPVMSAVFGREVLQVVLGAYTSAGRSGATVAMPFTGARNRTPLQLWRGE
jgi:myo-inositol 2-dehydrogenase/D-chiro-inositol 1-dehydrogenase